MATPIPCNAPEDDQYQEGWGETAGHRSDGEKDNPGNEDFLLTVDIACSSHEH